MYGLEKQDLVKYVWTNEIYQQRVEQEENRLFREENGKDLTEAARRRSSLIQQEMVSKYETMKNEYGLSRVEENDHEEQANNRMFATLHP